MSMEPSQSSGDSPGGSSAGPSKEGRRFSALMGSLAARSRDRGNQEDEGNQAEQVNQAEQGNQEASAPRPTFTARASGPAAAVTPGPADAPDAGAPARSAAPVPGTEPSPTTASPPATGKEATRPLPQPAAVTMDDEPLLSDADRLRARWQRAQAEFVDNPSQAVGDAADLIEQTAQALIGALRQRQRQLRVMWESGPDSGAGDGEPAARASDTEHLRLMMQHYRALFNQLCRP